MQTKSTLQSDKTEEEFIALRLRYNRQRKKDYHKRALADAPDNGILFDNLIGT